MTDPKRTCPECHLIFEAPKPTTGLLTCPLCGTEFPVQAPADPPPPPTPIEPSPVLSSRHMLKGCLVVGVLIFLVGGLVYAYHLIDDVPNKVASTPVAPPTVEPATAEPTPSEPVRIMPILPISPPPPFAPVVRKEAAPVTKMPPMPSLPTVPLTLPERVNRAIDRGIAYLRKNHNGHDAYRNYLGLLGLTLLECDVPGSDPAVQQIAGWLRTREKDLATTYELSLAILFLDRLGDPNDRPLIRVFGQRLLNGQLDCGAWSYSCSVDGPVRPGGLPKPTPRGPQTPQIISWKNGTPLNKPPVRKRLVFQGDNSNTQFALLGLWVAQRHGVSARRAASGHGTTVSRHPAQGR